MLKILTSEGQNNINTPIFHLQQLIIMKLKKYEQIALLSTMNYCHSFLMKKKNNEITRLQINCFNSLTRWNLSLNRSLN